MSENEPRLEPGQVREYMEEFLEGVPSVPMVVLEVSETAVKVRPLGAQGLEYLTYDRAFFEKWYPHEQAA